ncbi:MAG: response regulator, partial [Paenibacillus macerans]|nr:response regulator [Paenibacillus macerans]
MKAILIDDEHLALTYLEYQLNMIGEVEIIGKYTNPLEGRQAVEQLDVDIVFLDIQIPKINGLELAEILLEHKPYLHIVFITTYDEYAIKAFKLNALDYVLKPVELERLKLTIERTKPYKSRLDEPQETIKKWEIRTFGGFKIFDHRQKELQRFNWRTTRAQELFLY